MKTKQNKTKNWQINMNDNIRWQGNKMNKHNKIESDMDGNEFQLSGQEKLLW